MKKQQKTAENKFPDLTDDARRDEVEKHMDAITDLIRDLDGWGVVTTVMSPPSKDKEDKGHNVMGVIVGRRPILYEIWKIIKTGEQNALFQEFAGMEKLEYLLSKLRPDEEPKESK